MTREAVHKLVDAIPENDVECAPRLLEALLRHRDPVLLSLLAAAYDDEPLTAEDEAAALEGRKDIERGEGISHAEVMREFGL